MPLCSNVLGSRFYHLPHSDTGPKVLAACLPGEQHENGILFFALAAIGAGYHVTLLGANMPLDELPAAARRAHSEAIVLSGVSENSGDAERLESGLAELVKKMHVPVFVGGGVSVRYRDIIARVGAIPLGVDIEHGLRRIGSVLKDAADQ